MTNTLHQLLVRIDITAQHRTQITSETGTSEIRSRGIIQDISIVFPHPTVLFSSARETIRGGVPLPPFGGLQ